MSGVPESSVFSLVCALSEAIGQPILLDAQGECAMEFAAPGNPASTGNADPDATVEVVFAQAPDPDILSVRCALASVGQPPEGELFEAALTLNYTSVPCGYSIGFDPASRQLVLVALIDASQLSADAFFEHLAGFLELVPQLREALARLPLDTEVHEMIGLGVLA